MTALLTIVGVFVAAVICAALIWFAESCEPTNYERDEIPPPQSTITPQDWRVTGKGIE